VPRLREFKWDSWAESTYERLTDDNPPVVAVDTETTGVEFYDEPFAATLSWRGADGRLKNGYFALEGPGRDERISTLGFLLSSTPAWVFHNAKFDLQKLLLVEAIEWSELEHAELHDTQTMYTLLDENGRKGLKHLAVTLLKYDDTVKVPYKTKGREHEFRLVSREKYLLDEARKKLGLRKEDGYHLLPRDVLVPYALRDTDFTLQLYELLRPRMERKADPKLLQLYADSMDLKRVLLRMEADGFRLDLDYLRETTSEYGVKVMESWNRVVELTGNPELNPQSPAQLAEAFRARGLHLESTAADVLEKLDDPLAREILTYREVKKLHTTYLVGLTKAQREGIVHPNFNDDGARTGRMSSGSAKE
jgi:DNA polymerase-1